MIRFRMFGIHLEQFAILAPNNGKEIGMKISLGYKYADNGEKIACLANFDFGSQHERVMVLSVSCDFEIQKEDFCNLQKDGKAIISKELLEYFAVQTIGTARGILFCKTENTDFNNIVIPPVNVTELIKSDLIIQ